MKKKKSKKKKKGKFLNYKLFAFIGGIFHYIVYLLDDLTFYNDTLFWLSLLFCGIIFGVYFIKKMKLLNPDSYKKIEGTKLKLYMFTISFLTIIGTSILFGNVINGTILGLNYIGKTERIEKVEYKIQKIEQNRTGGRKRIRRNNPKVFLTKDSKLISVILSERFDSNKNYNEFKSIGMGLKKGLFGFEIIDNYTLKNKNHTTTCIVHCFRFSYTNITTIQTLPHPLQSSGLI